MTVQPTRDQPMTDHDRMNYWWRRATQAEARIRDLTQEVRDERAACLDQMEQVQIRDTRIKAVEDVLDLYADHSYADPEMVTCDDCAETIRTAIRRALGG